MNPTLRSEPRPEAMADVQGGCDLTLTRGIVLYREAHERDGVGGRLEDIGLGLVIEGRFAADATVVDLGSGRTKALDLSREIVILDWAYEPTLEHVRTLIRNQHAAGESGAQAAAERPAGGVPLASYCFDLALRVLKRAGYGPVTRPTFLRIGFRDACQDLDLHEGTAIRIMARPGTLYRIHLDYDAVALVVRGGRSTPDGLLEAAMSELFPSATLRRAADRLSPTLEYQLRFPLPVTLEEARRILSEVRVGLDGLIARFEPDRHRAVGEVLRTLGARDTLGRVAARSRKGMQPAASRRTSGTHRVH